MSKEYIKTFDVREEKRYTFDVDKINTIDDIKLVLDGLMIVFKESYPNLEKMKPLLKEYVENDSK